MAGSDSIFLISLILELQLLIAYHKFIVILQLFEHMVHGFHRTLAANLIVLEKFIVFLFSVILFVELGVFVADARVVRTRCTFAERHHSSD